MTITALSASPKSTRRPYLCTGQESISLRFVKVNNLNNVIASINVLFKPRRPCSIRYSILGIRLIVLFKKRKKKALYSCPHPRTRQIRMQLLQALKFTLRAHPSHMLFESIGAPVLEQLEQQGLQRWENAVKTQ
eukprot:TRINITY_DN9495_c0_g1_i2.p3 TRINITY_DN9495_c0_g1~~TRINITY_DN9495_c0_g1_i2.p3  ORF type:complete len:134 (-),score=6.04 TRINITY_DN9495_c0_g1_i2:1257-1658(-)